MSYESKILVDDQRAICANCPAFTNNSRKTKKRFKKWLAYWCSKKEIPVKRTQPMCAHGLAQTRLYRRAPGGLDELIL